MPLDYLRPDWPAPSCVQALTTLRPADGSLQGPAAVSAHLLAHRIITAAPFWLSQVHGIAVADADCAATTPPIADAAVSRQLAQPLVVQTADCLPVLFCDETGSLIAAAHAGWRGLAAGVLQATVAKLRSKQPDAVLMAWLGPAIGPQHFVVGAEVRAAFVSADPQAASAFTPAPAAVNVQPKYHCDLYALAKQILHRVGVTQIYGGGLCTASDPARFYSFRRDGRVIDHLRAMIWRV